MRRCGRRPPPSRRARWSHWPDQRPRTGDLAGRSRDRRSPPARCSSRRSSTAGEPIVAAAQAPPWIGPLDVLIVAGDDPGDPALVPAAATAVRRGARVLVAAPFEGPLRDATAGRAAVLAPRLWVPDDFALCRYLAVGLAALSVVDPAIGTDPAALADELDAEALRNSPVREVSPTPPKPSPSACRAVGRCWRDCRDPGAGAPWWGDDVAGGRVPGRRGGSDAFCLIACRAGASTRFADPVDALFHDEGDRWAATRPSSGAGTGAGSRTPGIGRADRRRRRRSIWLVWDVGRIGTGYRRPGEATTSRTGRAAGDGRGLS